MNNKLIETVSNISYHETMLEMVLNRQGANLALFMERFQSRKDYLQSKSRYQRLIIALYSGMMILFPIIAFNQIQESITEGIPSNWIIFVGAMTLGLFFLIQLGFMLMFGMLQTSTLISGDAYRILTILPISDKDLEKVVIHSFFKEVRTQLIVIAISFPLGIAITTQNLGVVLFAIFTSLINIVFSFSLLVLIGAKINKILRNNEVNTLKTNLIRSFTLLGMGLGSMMMILVYQFAFNEIESLFSHPPVNIAIFDEINTILSIIPFPFACIYFLIALSNSFIIPSQLWITTSLGVIIFTLLSRSLYFKAMHILKHVMFGEITQKQSLPLDQKIPLLKISTPFWAFFKKDILTATRDYQTMMLLLLPFLLPIIGMLTMNITNMEPSSQGYQFFVICTLYQLMSAFMLIRGFTTMELSGTTIYAALPMKIRDQACAKLLLIFILTSLTIVIPSLIIMNSTADGYIFMWMLLQIPLGGIFGVSTLVLKVFFFGHLKYKYVLEEIQLDHKNAKWGVIIGAQFGVYVLLISVVTFLSQQGKVQLFLGMICFYILIGIIFRVVFKKLFPNQ